jgi:hypothetical protein
VDGFSQQHASLSDLAGGVSSRLSTFITSEAQPFSTSHAQFIAQNQPGESYGESMLRHSRESREAAQQMSRGRWYERLLAGYMYQASSQQLQAYGTADLVSGGAVSTSMEFHQAFREGQISLEDFEQGVHQAQVRGAIVGTLNAALMVASGFMAGPLLGTAPTLLRQVVVMGGMGAVSTGVPMTVESLYTAYTPLSGPHAQAIWRQHQYTPMQIVGASALSFGLGAAMPLAGRLVSRLLSRINARALQTLARASAAGQPLQPIPGVNVRQVSPGVLEVSVTGEVGHIHVTPEGYTVFGPAGEQGAFTSLGGGTWRSLPPELAAEYPMLSGIRGGPMMSPGGTPLGMVSSDQAWMVASEHMRVWGPWGRQGLPAGPGGMGPLALPAGAHPPGLPPGPQVLALPPGPGLLPATGQGSTLIVSGELPLLTGTSAPLAAPGTSPLILPGSAAPLILPGSSSPLLLGPGPSTPLLLGPGPSGPPLLGPGTSPPLLGPGAPGFPYDPRAVPWGPSPFLPALGAGGFPALGPAVDPARTERLRAIAAALRRTDTEVADMLRMDPSSRNAERNLTLGELRHVRGQPSPELEGYIPDFILDANREALRQARTQLHAMNPDAIVGIERGGAFLAEATTFGDEALRSRMRTIPAFRAPAGSRGKYHPQEMQRAFRQLIEGGARNIVVVDAYMGGTTASDLRNNIFRPLLTEHPDVTITTFWYRETFGFERQRPAGGGVTLEPLRGQPKPNSPIFGNLLSAEQQVPVVLGDDMNIVVDRSLASRAPLRVFNDSGEVIATIVPREGETTRDALIRLMNQQ